MSDSRPVVVLSTCGDLAVAEQIATHLVEQHLAACVNLVSQVKSVYRWQTKIERAEEILLVIKSVKTRLPAIEKTIKELSGYEVPELVALDIADGSSDYLTWLQNEVGKE